MSRQISYQVLRSAVLRHIFRRPDHYADLAERSWTLAPPVTVTEPPAIYLDGELERVRGVPGDTTMDIEMARVRGGEKYHVETKAYLFKDVRLQAGHLFKGAMSHTISGLTTLASRAEEVDIASAAIASTLLGSRFFGHWMRDDSTLNLAVQPLAPTINVARQRYTHEAGYRELLSLQERHIARARFRELILLDDWGHNLDKRRRFAQLRATYRKAVPLASNERLYVRRGQTVGTRGRNLTNTRDVEQFLAAQGFVTIDPDAMSAQEIARAANGAKLIVGLEGSHLGHTIFPIADNGTLLLMQPPMRFNNPYKDVSDSLGLRYAFTIGQAENDGFRIDVDRLGRLLDRVRA